MQRQSGGGGLALAIVTAAAFATSGSFATSLFDAGWTPLAAVTVRVLTAAAVLTLPAVVLLRGRWGVLRRRAGGLTLFGVLAVAMPQLAFFNAVTYLPVGIALLLEYLAVILVVAWQWAVRGQRPGLLTAAGAAVALVGLVVVLDPGSTGALHPVGVLWGLVAAVGLASYFVLSAEIDAAVPPLGFAWLGLVVGGLVLGLAAVSGLQPVHAATDPVVLLSRPVSWLVPVIGLGLVAGALPYVVGVVATRRLGARTASVVSLVEVVFAVLFAWLLLSQLPGLQQGVGGAVILLGVVLVRLADLLTRPTDGGTPDDRTPGDRTPAGTVAAAPGAAAAD